MASDFFSSVDITDLVGHSGAPGREADGVQGPTLYSGVSGKYSSAPCETGTSGRPVDILAFLGRCSMSGGPRLSATARPGSSISARWPAHIRAPRARRSWSKCCTRGRPITSARSGSSGAWRATKDTDGNYLAVCRAPEAAENGLRLDALGNLISITVLRAVSVSDATVYRILRRHGLRRLPNRVGRRAVHTHRYAKQVPGHHVQVDVKFLTLQEPAGQRIRR